MGNKYKYSPDWVSVKEFEVTENHIKLLQRSMVNWITVGHGSPFIDFMQPYGSSCFVCDVAKILKIEPVIVPSTGKKMFTAEQITKMKNLHRETQTVLQIFLRTGKMKPGKYTQTGLQDWRRK